MRHLTLKLLTALLLSAVIVGCSDHHPDAILDKEAMAEVLYEVHVAESISRLGYNNTNYDLVYINILENHGLTPARFDTCIAWYTRHPAKYMEVYDVVKAKLSAEKSHIAEYHHEVKTPLLLTMREPAPTHFSTSDSCSHPYIERFRCGTPRWVGWDK